MYSMMAADLGVSALYFILAVVILDYFLLNMLVGVITTTFGEIRSATKHSAFANASAVPATTRFDDDKKPQRRLGKTASVVATAYSKTRLIWPALIVASVALQADRDYDMDPRKSTRYEWIELAFTLAFDLEIAIRLFASLPDWRSFFAGNANRVDTFLAVVTTFIQLPFVFHSPAYAWLTFFQIARFYRVVLAIPRMRRLLVRLAGTFVGVLNMLLFLLLITFFSALVAVQFLRGIPNPDSDDTGQLNYFQIYNAFLTQYQILSSENWTDPLKTVLSSQRGQFQIALSAIFICGWMVFAFFVIGNLFVRPFSLMSVVRTSSPLPTRPRRVVAARTLSEADTLSLPPSARSQIALLNENWQIEEDEKRARQLEAYVTRANQPGQSVSAGWTKRFDPYTLVTSRLRARADKQGEQVKHVEQDEPVEILDRMVTASPEPLSNDEDDKVRSSSHSLNSRSDYSLMLSFTARLEPAADARPQRQLRREGQAHPPDPPPDRLRQRARLYRSQFASRPASRLLTATVRPVSSLFSPYVALELTLPYPPPPSRLLALPRAGSLSPSRSPAHSATSSGTRAKPPCRTSTASRTSPRAGSRRSHSTSPSIRRTTAPSSSSRSSRRSAASARRSSSRRTGTSASTAGRRSSCAGASSRSPCSSSSSPRSPSPAQPRLCTVGTTTSSTARCASRGTTSSRSRRASASSSSSSSRSSPTASSWRPTPTASRSGT